MVLKTKSKILHPSANWNWARAIRTAISPPFWDDSRFPSSKANDAIFESFLTYVEGQRLAKRDKSPASLRDTATEVSLRMLSEVDTLDGFPKHLARRLWDALDKRCMLSFHTWRILSKALRQEPNVTLGMLQYRQAITFPTSSLRVYTDPLRSACFDFITSLSINSIFSTADLVQLAQIPNLGILEIIGLSGTGYPAPTEPSSSSVGDLLVRAWSREAVSNGAFPVLRILRLLNHDKLTHRCLQYLKAFQSLGLFDVRGCSITEGDRGIYDAEKAGWTRISKHGSLDVLDQSFLPKSIPVGVKQELDFQLAGNSNTKPLWDGARIHRVKRSAAQATLNHARVSPGNCRSDSAGSLPATNKENWPDYVKEVAEGDEHWTSLNWDLFRLVVDKDTWNSVNRECWARLGKIRQDTDLLKSGVRGIEEQTVLGTHLISPVPIAYIRLGERFNISLSSELDVNELDSSKDHLIFIRVNSNMSVTPSAQSVSKRVPNGMSKRKTTGLDRVRQSKKQNLGHELNEFKFL